MKKEDVERFYRNKKFMYLHLSKAKQQAYRILYRSICEGRSETEVPLLDEQGILYVIRALRYDFPEMIEVELLSVKFQILEDRTKIYFSYHFPENQRSIQQKRLDHKCKKIITELKKKYKDEISLEVMICAWIIKNVKYGTIEGMNGQSAYEALMLGTAVCHGISALFKVLADMAGIEETLIVSGMMDVDGKTDRHSWNIVKIRGKYAHIDVTNDGFMTEIVPGKKIHYPSGVWFNFTDYEAYVRYRWDISFFPRCNSPEISYCALQGNLAHSEKEIYQILKEKMKAEDTYITIKLDKHVHWKDSGEKLINKAISDVVRKRARYAWSWNKELMVMTMYIE